MKTIHLDDFLSEGLIRESSFRSQLKNINWVEYRNQRVLIKGCASSPIPTWAYLMLTAELSQVAEHILYGEPCAAVKVFSKN